MFNVFWTLYHPDQNIDVTVFLMAKNYVDNTVVVSFHGLWLNCDQLLEFSLFIGVIHLQVKRTCQVIF